MEVSGKEQPSPNIVVDVIIVYEVSVELSHARHAELIRLWVPQLF